MAGTSGSEREDIRHVSFQAVQQFLLLFFIDQQLSLLLIILGPPGFLDVQPVTNMRILRQVKSIGGSDRDWAKWLMTDGLAAYEKLSAPYAGKFSYGDDITIADAGLMPAVWGAWILGRSQ